MGAENFVLLFLAVVYGYHCVLLLFGTSHCLSILLGARALALLACSTALAACKQDAGPALHARQTAHVLCCGLLPRRHHYERPADGAAGV